MDWTVDTVVLYLAANANVDSMYLLLRILQETHGVAFDCEGHIEQEYRHCIERTRNRLVGKWFKAAVNKLAIVLSGKLTQEHQRAVQRLGFDRDDWPFVAVCSRTESKSLVSEDSDYTGEVREYLHVQMGVCVRDVKASLEICG